MKETTIQADEVTLERKLGNIIPDVLLRVKNRLLIIEIRVAHAVDAAKRKKIEDMNISAVEFDFRDEDRAITKQDLKNALVFGKGLPKRGWGEWVYPETGGHAAGGGRGVREDERRHSPADH